MRRLPFAIIAAASALLLGAMPVYAQQFRTGLSFAYGSTSSDFGLASPSFYIPAQSNTSNDAVISANLEYLLTRRLPVDFGLALKGSLGFSGWDLGPTQVVDSFGEYFYADDVIVNANWWALAAMGTAHLHLGPFVTLDGAVGYGPYGYFNVSYYDAAGVTYGPVTQAADFFPPITWGVDWSAGVSFGFLRLTTISLDVGMMGPDFVTGLGVSFRY